MLQRLRAVRQEREKGFTLTELLIVIIILGVLAGIVVFAVQAFQNRGQEAACKTDYKNLQVATEAYYAQTGGYPTAWANIVPNYLKDKPTGNGYTIDLYAGGVIVTTGACTNGTAPAGGTPLA